MAHTSSFVFTITAMLAIQLGHTVSLRISEDNSFGANSLTTVASANHFLEGLELKDILEKLEQFSKDPAKTALPPFGLPSYNPNEILTQLTNKVNKSLADVTSKAVSLVDKLEQKTNQLLVKANSSWSQYAKQLNNSLANTADQVANTIHAIQNLINEAIPPSEEGPMKDAVDSLTKCLDNFANASLLAQNVSKAKALTYAEVNKTLTTLNGTMYDGLAFGLDGTSKLYASFKRFSDKMIKTLEPLPAPDAMLSALIDIIGMVTRTLTKVRPQVDRAMTVLVKGVERASFNAAAILLTQELENDVTQNGPNSGPNNGPNSGPNNGPNSGPNSGALRIEPLLGAMLAVGAVAFH